MRPNRARRKRRRDHRHIVMFRDVPRDGTGIETMAQRAFRDLPPSHHGRVAHVDFQHDDSCRALVTRAFRDCSCERINIRLELRELEGC